MFVDINNINKFKIFPSLIQNTIFTYLVYEFSNLYHFLYETALIV